MKFPTYGEYKRLFKKAERILDREVVKPLGKRDEALIDECEETMLFCAERMKALRPEKEGSARRSMPRGLRRAVIVAAACAVLLALSATVAQAAGVRVWSALVHWDKNYLRVDYSVNGEQDPPKGEYRPSGSETTGSVANTQIVDLDSEEQMRELLGSSLLYPYGMEGLEFVSAKAFMVDDLADMVDLKARYFGEEFGMNASINKKNVPEQGLSYTSIWNGKFDRVENKTINGVECVCASSADSSVLTFSVNKNVYTLKGKMPIEQLELIAADMLQ